MAAHARHHHPRPGDIRLSDVPDPTITSTHRRDRQGGGRLHLRLGPVAVPRRERHRRRLDDRPRVRRRRRGGRGRGARRSGPATSWSCRSATATTPARTAGPACSRPASNQGCTESGQAEYALVHQADGSLVKTDGMPDDDADPVAAGALRRDGDRLARRRRGRRARGRYGGRGRRRRGRAVRRARRVGDGRREGHRDVAARAAPGDRPQVRRHPHRRRARQGGRRRRSRRSPAASAPTRSSSASAPTQAMQTAFGVARPGLDGRLRRRTARRGAAGAADVPEERRARRRHGAGTPLPAASCWSWSSTGTINPGLVFDATLPLDEVAEGYRAMDERRSIKVLIRP